MSRLSPTAVKDRAVAPHRFALYTDDIDASVARFEKAGGKPLTAPRSIPYATEKGPGNKVCYCQMPWGTTMEFITTPDRMPYHDQTDLRRWQDGH